MLRTLSAAQASRQEAVTQTRLTVMAGKQKSRFTGKLWGSGALLWEFSMRNSNRNSSECSHYNRSSGWSTLVGFARAETTTPCVAVNAELHSEWSGTPTQIRPFFLVCFIFVHIFQLKKCKNFTFLSQIYTFLWLKNYTNPYKEKNKCCQTCRLVFSFFSSS